MLLSQYQWCAASGWCHPDPVAQNRRTCNLGTGRRHSHRRGGGAEVDRVVGAEVLVELAVPVPAKVITSSWCNDVEHVIWGRLRCCRKQRCSSKNCGHQEGRFMVWSSKWCQANARLMQSLTRQLPVAGVFVLSASSAVSRVLEGVH